MMTFKLTILESQINESLKKDSNLLKKFLMKVSSGDIAYYSDTDVASDYVYNQDEGNLIPIYERILFSGIPEPISKPIPNKPEYFKSITLSLKNEKMLIKNLENYLNKVDFSTVFEGLKDFFNYSIEENITFFMDENDNVVEIQTFSKNLQNLNLIKRDDGNFVFFIRKKHRQLQKLLEID